MFKGMLTGLKDFVPLFQAFLAFIALIGGFTFAVNMVVNPVKAEQVEIKAEQVEIKAEQVEIKIELKEIKADIKEIKRAIIRLEKNSSGS